MSKNLITLLFLLFVQTLCAQTDPATTPIGRWKMDYKKSQGQNGCGDGLPSYTWYRIRYGRVYLQLNNDSTYKEKIWGDKSNGHYTIQSDTLIRYPEQDAPNADSNQYIQSISADELVIRFYECDVAYYWYYRRKK